MNILFLTNRLPHPKVVGGHRLIYRRMKRLKDKGHKIGIIALTLKENKIFLSEIRDKFDEVEIIIFKEKKFFQRIYHYFNPSLPAIFWKNRSKTMMKKVGEIVLKSNYDIIVAEYGEMGQYLYRNPYLSAVHKIVSCHRCLTDSFEKYITTSKVSLILKLKCLIQYKRLKNYEFEMYNAMDHIITLTNKDRINILNHAPQLPVSVVPPGIDLEDLNNTKVSKKPDFPLLMMCGYFADKSNNDAAVWFIHMIWPIIYRKDNNIKCWFIGKGIGREMQNAATNKPGITLISDIENLRPYRKSATVFINPMRLGSGLRIKILEAMGTGLPVVTTTLGAAGIPAQNGVNCLISDTPKEFAESILWLIKDKNLSKKIGDNAKLMVEKRYEIQFCINQLETIFNDTISI